MADEMMRQLGPLPAEEGINLASGDAPDLETLQVALNRAVERHNLELFSRVGATREVAVAALRRVVDAVLTDDCPTGGRRLSEVQSESPEIATASSCVGVALGLLDEALISAGAPNIARPRPGTGTASARRPTFLPQPARARPPGRWTSY